MPKPIGFFASAPCGTSDATNLNQIEQEFGSYLERLTPSELVAWIVTLVTEAVELQGIEFDICIDNHDLEALFPLSNGTKLDLAAAALSYLREQNTIATSVGQGLRSHANL